MEEKYKKRFIAVYNEEVDSIFRFCLFRISNREKAVEMAQETFTKFWNILISNRDIQNDKAILFFIARNMIIDWYRKKKEISLESILEKEDYVIEIKDEDFSSNVEMQVEGKHLLERINKLSSEYRQVVYLRFVEGLGPKEIGEILEESPNAIAVKVSRALKKLKKIAGYENN